MKHAPSGAGLALEKSLRLLKKTGFRVLGLETDGPVPLEQALAEGAPRAGGLMLLLGQEQAGLSREARRACDAVCHLAGGGAVDSLNVSVAAAVALAAAMGSRLG